MPSVLADAPFLHYALTYAVQSVESTGVDQGGNPTFGTTAGSVTALLAPLTTLANPMLQRREGADTQGLLVKGELIDPLTLPPGIGLGSELGVTYAGQTGVLTILSILPNDLVGVDFGDAFEGEIRVV